MISKSFERFFSKDQKIVLGLSGGADSIALAHSLIASKVGEKNLIFFHANYHLRGQESDDDQKFCEELAARFNVRIICQDFFLEKDASHIQKNARDLRRRALSEIAKQENAAIAFAHHQDDLFETILFRLFRGANLKTITPFTEYDGKIWRPLINLKKKEILDFLHLNQIKYREDSSNLSVDYTRNALRLKIIPEILSQFPSAQNKVVTFSETIKNVVEEILPKSDGLENKIAIPKSVSKEILKIWLYEHIQKRMKKFHAVSDVMLNDFLINEDYFANISDEISLRREKDILTFITRKIAT